MSALSLLSMMISLNYLSSSHPAILMILILTQTAMICVAAWLSVNTSWFSYILFLVFLGGLMVLFIYIVSLASNEKFQLLSLSSSSNMIFVWTVATTMILSQTNISTEHLTLRSSSTTFFNMYSTTISSITITTMIYLLLTLIVVVKMASKYNAPIKNMIYS